MNDLILTTSDWVPEPPRGYVRDLRVTWALEEAELPYRVEDVLRLVDRSDGLAKYPACYAYVERATARPRPRESRKKLR